MKDRLACTPAILSNGIKVYLYEKDIPFVCLRYIVPFGHKHNRGEVIPGSFHFLEHLALNRSKEFPECDSFSRFIGLHGGYVNAYTTYRATGFEINFPLSVKERALKGFFSQIFETVFSEEDIKREATIIQNERKRKERWYPGYSEISHFLNTKWRCRDPKFLCTIFGSDKDHAKYNVEYFKNLHERYHTNQGYLVAAGNITLPEIAAIVEKFQTKPYLSPQIADPEYSWKNPQYSEHAFDDESRFEYMVGGHFGPITFDDFFTLKFMGSLLFNSVHGPIYKWLRDEKGWLYEIRFGFDYEHSNTPWTVSFPLSSFKQVDIVRKELLSRIYTALEDEELIQDEVVRTLGREVFQYQRPEDLIEDAEAFLTFFNTTGSETQIRSIIQGMTSAKLLRFFKERIVANQIGEVLILPKKKIDLFGIRKTVGMVTDEINDILTMPKRKMNKQLVRIKRQLRKLV